MPKSASNSTTAYYPPATHISPRSSRPDPTSWTGCDGPVRSPVFLVHPTQFLAPLGPTATLLLAGGNYQDHLDETGLTPKEPVFFSKLRSAVIGPDDAIRIPTRETDTDWEAELCIIIGKPAYRVPAERAHEYIFGYTMINDVSARDVMAREPLQITLCKCPDTFAPVGPHVVTVDEVPDPNTPRAGDLHSRQRRIQAAHHDRHHDLLHPNAFGVPHSDRDAPARRPDEQRHLRGHRRRSDPTGIHAPR